MSGYEWKLDMEIKEEKKSENLINTSSGTLNLKEVTRVGALEVFHQGGWRYSVSIKGCESDVLIADINKKNPTREEFIRAWSKVIG